MPFPTDELLLGPASYGRRKGTEGFCWHTTESADASRQSAIATALWQATPGKTTGSYNFIIFDGGLFLTVPFLEASGGIGTGSTAWAPERYPNLQRDLSAAAYADPNAYLLNVAFSGKTAVFRDQGIPDNMIDTARRLTAWATDLFGRPMVHTAHFMWQTNRSDPSQKVLDLITAGDPVDWHDSIKYVPPALVQYRPGTSYRLTPDLTPESAPKVLPYVSTRRVIGTVRGFDFGSGPDWDVIVSGSAGLLAVHPQDRVQTTSLVPEPEGGTVSLASYTALQLQASGIMRERARAINTDADVVAAKKP